MKSSLQQAAAGGRDVVVPTKAGPTKGHFEKCFAGGLDLSEFGGSASESMPSHAALLLQVKQAESADRLQQEQEEVRMQDAVLRRTEELKEASKILKGDVLPAAPPSSLSFADRGPSLELLHRNRDSRLISALVVGMHWDERKDEPRHKSKRLNANPRPKANHVKHSKQTKDKQIVKKTKQSKH